MSKLTKTDTLRLLDIIYERCENGQITLEQQCEAVDTVECQNPEFTENIIDDQIERLDLMYKNGKISKDVYDAQIEKWNQKRALYEKNLQEERLKEEIQRRKNAKNPVNMIKRKLDLKRGKPSEFRPATESVLDFFKGLYE